VPQHGARSLVPGPAEKHVLDQRKPGVSASTVYRDAQTDFAVKRLDGTAAERIDARQQRAAILAGEPDVRHGIGPGQIEVEIFDVPAGRRQPRAKSRRFLAGADGRSRRRGTRAVGGLSARARTTVVNRRWQSYIRIDIIQS